VRKVIKILPLITLALLSVLLMTGRVRFGWGPADVIFHGLIYISLLTYVVYLIFKKEANSDISLIVPGLSIMVCVYLFMSMTFLRGGAYPWNGDILEPTQKEAQKRKQKKYEDDLALIDKQIEQSPRDYNLLLDKGYFLRNNGKYDLAIEVLSKAQQMEPDRYKAYWESGYAYSLKEDYINAIVEYEKAYNADTTKYELRAQIIRMKEKYMNE